MNTRLIKCLIKSFSSRLANKQDKMNALLGNELIEILSLEKLVNESRSLCHIVRIVIIIIIKPIIFLVILRFLYSF